jgi:hypothetical protein
LAIINEIQIQDSCSSDEDSVAVPPTKTAMVCKLAQIPPEIWMTLPLEAKKWLLNETKHQQKENEKMKKSLALIKFIAVPNDKKLAILMCQINMQEWKNVAKGEDVIKENTDQTFAFVDEFFEEAMKSHKIIMLMEHLSQAIPYIINESTSSI